MFRIIELKMFIITLGPIVKLLLINTNYSYCIIHIMMKIYAFISQNIYPSISFLAPTCSSNPCLNGAACFEAGSGNGFICQCASGYTGTNCETTCKLTK